MLTKDWECVVIFYFVGRLSILFWLTNPPPSQYFRSVAYHAWLYWKKSVKVPVSRWKSVSFLWHLLESYISCHGRPKIITFFRMSEGSHLEISLLMVQKSGFLLSEQSPSSKTTSHIFFIHSSSFKTLFFARKRFSHFLFTLRAGLLRDLKTWRQGYWYHRIPN